MNLAQITVDYFKSVKEEFKKVSWPSRRDTFRYSALVIGISVVVATFFASLDAGFSKLVEAGVNYRTQLQAQSQVKLPDVTVTTTTAPEVTPTASPDINLNNASPITTPTPAPITIPVPTNK